jgi:hypothetical protein
MIDRKFEKDRDAALAEIQKAMGDKIQDLAVWSQSFVQGKDPMVLPDYLKLQEVFRWPTAVSMAAGDLKENKSLKDVFSRVSSRYQAPKRQQVLGVADDFVRSADAKLDGRLSAFEDVLKVLDVAERDFDATYRPLSSGQIEFWQKKHPLPAEYLETAYRENQRHFMKESIKDMRALLIELRDGKQPSPGVKGQKPPRP